MQTHLTPDQIDDIRSLRETMRWQYWPFCPVKKGDEVAFVFDDEQGRRTVFRGNLFSVLKKEISIKTLEKIQYSSSYEMVVDGWRVD